MSTSSPGAPSRLGKYEVGAKIGGGGMAAVYIGRALREDGSEELVALKVIKDELASDERFRRMFVDEAKILARLSHPNVIETREYGITGEHRFIAMELLSGRTYADVWDLLTSRREGLPPRLGAWVCARIAAGLHSAHELLDDAGAPLHVIHRDVNPSNIFLTHAGAVKLIDFGLAKARLRSAESVDGIVKGKIPYLAPEQAHGLPIDRRVDVYALGTTLWETAARKRLFKRDTDVATLMAIRDAEIPDLREVVPELPEALWTVIAKATAREPEERYASAAELQVALDAFVGDGADMPDALASLMGELFPGEEERQATWARAATSVTFLDKTMRPPAPVPTASSRMIGEAAPVEPAPRSTEEPAARRAPRSTEEPAYLDRAADPAGARRLGVSLAAVVAAAAVLWALLGARG